MWRARRISPRDARMAKAGAGGYKVLRRCRAGRDTHGNRLNTVSCNTLT